MSLNWKGVSEKAREFRRKSKGTSSKDVTPSHSNSEYDSIQIWTNDETQISEKPLVVIHLKFLLQELQVLHHISLLCTQVQQGLRTP